MSVNFVDLVKSFHTRIYYFILKKQLRYSRERASQSLEVIQVIHSFIRLLGTDKEQLQRASHVFPKVLLKKASPATLQGVCLYGHLRRGACGPRGGRGGRSRCMYA